MNKLGETMFDIGVSSQRLSELSAIRPAYKAVRHRLHGSDAKAFIRDVHWLPVKAVLDEDDNETWLPEAAGNPNTPPWADFLQHRKNTSVVVCAGIEEISQLAARHPEGVPALTVRFEEIAIAGLFPNRFADLGVSRDEVYYQAGAREGAKPFEVGLTIHVPETRTSYAPAIAGIDVQNLPNDSVDIKYPGTPLV